MAVRQSTCACRMAISIASNFRKTRAKKKTITSWFPNATELAGLKLGESVVVYGCGPVGLMAALSAKVKGASQILVFG